MILVFVYLKFDLSVYKNVMYDAMLVKFCYLPRFIIISSVHSAFSLSIMCMRKTLESKVFAKKVLKTF